MLVFGARTTAVLDTDFAACAVQGGFAVTEDTASFKAEFSGSAFLVHTAGRAAVAETDLTVVAFVCFAAVGLLAGSVQAELAFATGNIGRASGANTLCTNQATFAVGVLNTSFAGFAGCVADLARLTVLVFAASSFASTTFTDGSGVALGVFGAGATCILDAGFSVAAVFVTSAVSFGTGVLEAELSGVALFVGETGIAGVRATDLIVGAIAVFQTFYAGFRGFVAFGSCVVGASFVVAAAFLATTVLTNLAFATGSIVCAGFAPSSFAELSPWAWLLGATERFAAFLAQADLTCCTVAVCFAAFLTFGVFADLSKPTIRFGLTNGASTVFADLPIKAGVASGAAFGTATFFADLSIATSGIIFTASDTLFILANFTCFALGVVKAAALAGSALA